MSGEKKAVLLGATGLVGRHVLERLLASPAYGEVRAIVRRPLPERDRLVQIVLPNFAAMNAAAFEGAEDVFCALGTTIRQAGTQEKFREVDFGYVSAAARFAASHGAQRFILVSSMGADARSRIFYSRVKGEAEDAVRAAGIPMVSIVRPSLLLGGREQFRFGEWVASLLARPLSFLFRGPLLPAKPIQADDVAAVMVRVAQMYTPGVHIYENDQLHRMAPNSR